MAGQEPETATSRARLTLSAIVDSVLGKEGRQAVRVSSATRHASSFFSASSRFSRAFSYSRCFNRTASSGGIALNCDRKRW
jgi:hypothetical protein